MEILEKYLLTSLDQDFTNFIVERIAKNRDEKAEELLEMVYDTIEEYKNNQNINSVKHYDKLVDAISDLLIYYESKIYIKAFMDGISLQYLNDEDK